MAEHIVKIELGDDSRKLLETLLKELCIVSDTVECIRLELEGRRKQTGAAPALAPEPAPTKDLFDEDGGEITPPWEEPAPEPAPEKKVDRETVRKLVMDLSGTDKKPQVREIVKAYADSVTAIPEDKLAEVWDKLTELEKQKKVRL